MFARLFLTHLSVVLVGVVALLVIAELFAPRFYQDHINRMMAAIGPSGASLHTDLETGLRSTLTAALLSALPLAVLLAAGTSLLLSRRVSRSVGLLAQGSQEIAQGNYTKRLPHTDNDELGALAEHFNQMAAALENVERSRVELISTVAHELRTPLAALQGYAEALSDGVIPAEDAAARIRREVRAMSRLVEDLSLVSRIEAGAVELHLQTVDARLALQEASERFDLAFADKNVGLELELPPSLEARADPLRLQQVLSNLLSNALRHTPPQGRVTLGARALPEAVKFYVRDTGAGIDPKHQQRVFERFYRVDSARSRTQGGSGVGLTVAKGLVEAMGGKMGLESTPGQGSTFWFSFPTSGEQ